MKKRLWLATMGVVGCASFFAGSFATAEPSKDAAPEMQLPPGWTMEDMQSCIVAGMPGKMHEHLAQAVGEWEGKEVMCMAPGTPEISTSTTMKVTSLMDGRYIQIESLGDMPGMGPFKGMGIYGFDNVSQKFVAVWLDNMGTGLMNGTGELSADGKTITTNYTYNCPINKKPAIMREIASITGPNTRTLEMFANDPKSGKEFRMLKIEFTRKG